MTRSRGVTALALAAALGIAALSGCSTGTTPTPSAETAKCSDAQINALLSQTGFSLPPLVGGLTDLDFTPPEVIAGHTPQCVAHANIDVAGIVAEGSVAVIPGGQATFDALEAHFTEQGWAPSSTSGIMGVMVGQYAVGVAPLTTIVTDPTQLAEFDNPDDLIAVTAVAGG